MSSELEANLGTSAVGLVWDVLQQVREARKRRLKLFLLENDTEIIF